MPSICYLDGEYVSLDDARIPATDLAVLRGYGIFDFTRTYHGQPFYLDRHIARLYRSAALIEMALPWDAATLRDITLETVRRNLAQHPANGATGEFNVRIVVTGGESPDFLNPVDRPRLLVLVTPVSIVPEVYYREGAPIITVSEARILPDAKTTNYIPAILALKQARKRGAIDAIYVNAAGRVLEGTTNNLFIFHGDTLVTPEAGVLPGITRGVVLELAETVFTVERRDLTLEEVYAADEAFLTSSVKEMLPVRTLDGQVIGAGAPGPNTRRLHRLFREHAGAAPLDV